MHFNYATTPETIQLKDSPHLGVRFLLDTAQQKI